jgi:adenylate cyclase, class 2
MQFEVEQKHRIEDIEAFAARLAERGVVVGPPVEQADEYFAHPCRDFATTDEALRIRSVTEGSFVTYKGPRLDTTTKTRRELELPLDARDASGCGFAELLEALGFTSVGVVRKSRRTFQLEHGGRQVEGALDDVDGVGTFVELELVADEATIDDAKSTISALAAELDLAASERRSYLEMLLVQSAQAGN